MSTIKWLQSILEKQMDTYFKNPEFMISFYREELKTKKETSGRELLELLQNSDDEAAKTDRPFVLIKLEKNRLIVSNNGSPFSKKGIRSLMIPNVSGKLKDIDKIGIKGLGFRSVLNWAESIQIDSGLFSLEFSRKHAIDYYKQISKRHKSFNKKVKEIIDEDYPIPTLSAPRSTKINRSKEYDTSVILKFKDEHILSLIQEQINDLELDVLLFLNNITEIQIESPDRNAIIRNNSKFNKVDKEIVELDESGNIISEKKWTIFSKEGDLPEQFRDGEYKKRYKYDLRIAVSPLLNDSIHKLFTYFRTEVDFPFPAIIHGNFELDGSRNHLVPTEVNGYLINQLIDLMILTSLCLSKDEVSWKPLKLLTWKGNLHSNLIKLDFENLLIEKIKKNKLFPVISEDYIDYDDKPIYYKNNLSEFLYSNKSFSIFPHLLKPIPYEEIRILISKISFYTYKQDFFISQINSISNALTIHERAQIIKIIANHYSEFFKNDMGSVNLPNLFIDDDGELISSIDTAIFPPERSKFKVPRNIRLKIINKNLSDKLREIYFVSSTKSLIDKLRNFNVEEYSFSVVLKKLIYSITESRRKESKLEKTKKLIIALYKIFSENENSIYSDIHIPGEIKIQLFNKKNVVKYAIELYFSINYSFGDITEHLLSRVDKNCFVASPKQLGLLDEPIDKVEIFLNWLGVKKTIEFGLKDIQNKHERINYGSYVVSQLNYPYKTNWGDEIESENSFLSNFKYHYTSVKVDLIDNLEIILKEANYEYIIVWILTKLKEQVYDNKENESAHFIYNLPNKQSSRELRKTEIKSYITWKIKSTEWLPVKSGEKACPVDCVLSTMFDDYSTVFNIPAINYRSEIFRRYNITKGDIEYLLTKLGVVSDLSNLPINSIYSILLALPGLNIEHNKIKSLYRLILLSLDNKTSLSCENYNKYILEGKILAETNEKTEFLPIKSVYYLDKPISRNIRKIFNIAVLDRKRGSKKVEKVFGIKPLKDLYFILKKVPINHELSSVFNRDFNDFRPYLLAYRMGKVTNIKDDEINRIKKLRIVLCSQIEIELEKEGIIYDLEVNNYDSVITQDKINYVKLEKQFQTIEELKNDDSFCDSISEIICNLLNNIEESDFIRNFYSKSREKRENDLKLAIGDVDLLILDAAKKKLQITDSLESEFWYAILKILRIKLSGFEEFNSDFIFSKIPQKFKLAKKKFQYFFSKLNYSNLSDFSNYNEIKSLFNLLKIDLSSFNKISFQKIDFLFYYRELIISIHKKFAKKYFNFIFSELSKKSIQEKYEFINKMEEYLKKELPVLQNSVNYSCESEFNNWLKEEFNCSLNILEYQVDFDIEKQFNEKLELAKNFLTNQKIDTSKLRNYLSSNRNIKSLIYFGDFKEVKQAYISYLVKEEENSSINHNGSLGFNNQDFDNYANKLGDIQSEIEKEVEELDLKIIEISTSKSSHQPTKGSRKRNSFVHSKNSNNNEEIGLLGELYAFEILKKTYGDKIKWVSGYSKNYGNDFADDNLGYDMLLEEEDPSNNIYFEVKATTSDIMEFYLSKGEIDFALNHKESYMILYINNIKSKNKKFHLLKDLFVFSPNENFLNNSKFEVESDSFKIKFTKK